MLALASVVSVVLWGSPDAGPAHTDRTPLDYARVQFRLGDLQKAIDTVRACERSHPKQCRPLKVALVEYQALAHDTATFKAAEAKAFLKWDATISPCDPGRLTVPVLARWVTGPLKEAQLASAAGNPRRAKELVLGVLAVQPGNAEAKAMLAQLAADGG